MHSDSFSRLLSQRLGANFSPSRFIRELKAHVVNNEMLVVAQSHSLVDTRPFLLHLSYFMSDAWAFK